MKIFLTVYLQDNSYRASQSATYLRRVTEPWDEQTITWNTQPSTTTADQVSVPAPATTTSDFEIDVTNLVRLMNDGQSNHGFLWILNPEQKWRSVFAASSDYSDPAKRPKLVVTYQPMKKYFYLKDHLGNIRVTVDENGDVKGYNDYYPFGLRMRSMNNALAMDMYKYSSKELEEEELEGYAPFSVRMISKGFLDGNAAAIYVNDSYISDSGLYARGYTIVVVDENGTVVDKAHFDTYSSTAEADAMADFINNVATGHYVIGVIKDDGSQSMTENAYNALASVGCQHSREVGFRYSYAFIGKKGESSCGYEAYAPAGQGFVDKRIGESQSLAWYYFGARYYDPEVGRWLSVDPMGYKTPYLSSYNYVRNNPLNRFDLDGREDWGAAFKSAVYILGSGIGAGLGLAAMISACGEEVVTGGVATPFATTQFISGSVAFKLGIIGVGDNFASLLIALKTPDGMKAEEFRTFKEIVKAFRGGETLQNAAQFIIDSYGMKGVSKLAEKGLAHLITVLVAAGMTTEDAVETAKAIEDFVKEQHKLQQQEHEKKKEEKQKRKDGEENKKKEENN
ncbi:interleukin-like EMT inducer domain-containing protein [Calditrichota bacterium LG24]